MEKWNNNKIIWAIFLVSLLTRIIYVYFYNVNPIAHGQDINYGDQPTYWHFAEAFLRDSSWISDDVSFRPPIYPLFLAMIVSVAGSGNNFINIMLAQSFMSAVCVVIIYYLALNVFNKPSALFTAVWAALNPFYLYYSGYMLRENLTIMFFLLFTLLLIKFIKEQKRTLIIMLGLLYTLLIHTDPRFLFHAPFVVLYLYTGLHGWRNTLKSFSLFILIVIICSIPWGFRNHMVDHDSFVVINKETKIWFNKLLSDYGMSANDNEAILGVKKPRTLEEFEALKRKAIHTYQSKRDQADFLNNTAAQKDGPHYSMIVSDEELNAFMSGIRPTYNVLHKYFYHFKEFWRFARFKPEYDPYPDLRFEPVWSRLHNMIGILSSGILYPFFAIGVFFCAKFYLNQYNKYGFILLLIIMVHTLLHVIVHSRGRYRVPIDAFVAIIAFFSIMELISRFHISETAKKNAGSSSI